jgi:hypothetical protein
MCYHACTAELYQVKIVHRQYIYMAGAKGVCGGWGRHPPIHQVVGKILNPSRQNMDLDGKKKYLSDTD